MSRRGLSRFPSRHSCPPIQDASAGRFAGFALPRRLVGNQVADLRLFPACPGDVELRHKRLLHVRPAKTVFSDGLPVFAGDSGDLPFHIEMRIEAMRVTMSPPGRGDGLLDSPPLEIPPPHHGCPDLVTAACMAG